MLSFELSYDELLTYQGTNPRPADFDEFWDKALLSLDEFPADAEFVDATDFPLTTATAQHLYVKKVYIRKQPLHELTSKRFDARGFGIARFLRPSPSHALTIFVARLILQTVGGIGKTWTRIG